MRNWILCVICLLAITEAKGKKKYYFNLYDEMKGSWAIMETNIKISTGEPFGYSVQSMINVTASDIPQELLIAEIDMKTHEENRKPYQRVLSVPSNFSGSLYFFRPGAENEIENKMSMQFNELLRDETYFACGTLASNPNLKYEFTILPGKLFQIDISDYEKDERVLYMGKKVIIEKPKTWLEKYSIYLIMLLAVGVQFYMTNQNQQMFQMPNA